MSLLAIKEFFGIKSHKKLMLDEDHDGIDDNLQYKIVKSTDLQNKQLSKQHQHIQHFIEEILHDEIDEEIKWIKDPKTSKITQLEVSINPPCDLNFKQSKQFMENTRILQHYFYTFKNDDHSSLKVVFVLDESALFKPDIKLRNERKNMKYQKGEYTEGNPEDYDTIDAISQTMLCHLPILNETNDGTLDGDGIIVKYSDGIYTLKAIIPHNKIVEPNDLKMIEATSSNITSIRTVSSNNNMYIHVQLRSVSLKKRQRED